jgi:hypothetical protein
LDVVLPAFPVRIVLLQDVAARPPLEWAGDEFAAWIEARRARWGDLADELVIVGRGSALAPFAEGRFSRSITLTEWLTEKPAQQAGSSDTARINISRRNGNDLPKLALLAPTAQTVLDLPDRCIIDVRRPDGGWPAELAVAEFAGVEEDQLVVDTSWVLIGSR